ncbi:MAG: molybdopterin molybdotransferase MoeA [Cocleimonas sp.]|nr:molybdopterin molybdotransferase MoeA [Cocleimonas sp.]
MSACGCDDIGYERGCDNGQKLMPIDEALALLLGNANPITETEKLSLIEAQGRILAEDLSSTIDVPPHNNSSMDGYAVRSTDLVGSSEKLLPISQRIPAGVMGSELKAGTVARIFTGAPIPAGADAVVMQEVCTVVGEGVDSAVKITGPVPAGKNIRNAGEDIRTGGAILKAGIKLKPQGIGLAASVGIGEITVYKRLRVGIFFTGDELREPGETLEAGQIYNSNRHTMRGLLENLNCEIIDLGTVEDTLEATKAAMLKAAEQSDLVVTSGGVSVGEEDYIRIALEEIGQLDMWRINIKPGKPLAFGKVGDTPFLGMPGNPVSVFATFCIFARPFILQKQGASETKANSFMVPAAFEWAKAGKRHEYVRARIENGAIQLFPHQGSGVLTSTSWANGLAIIPADTTIQLEEMIEFIPFSELSVF